MVEAEIVGETETAPIEPREALRMTVEIECRGETLFLGAVEIPKSEGNVEIRGPFLGGGGGGGGTFLIWIFMLKVPFLLK